MMVRILLNKNDIRNILAWAGLARISAENANIPFEDDEELTFQKIKSLSKTQANPEDLSTNKDFTAQSVSPKVCPQCNKYHDEFRNDELCMSKGKPS